MGIIRNALVGIALYEVVSYLLKKGSKGSLDSSKSLTGSLSGVQTPSIGSLNLGSEERSNTREHSSSSSSLGSDSSLGSESNSSSGSKPHSNSDANSNSNLDLAAGSNPELPLSGDGSLDPPKDEWSNSLANDELRAPDS